jgi:hypothetical protein
MVCSWDFRSGNWVGVAFAGVQQFDREQAAEGLLAEHGPGTDYDEPSEN